MVKITWHLHSFFEIESARGIRILIDPHDGGSLNLEQPRPGSPVHAILVTHDHFDHNAASLYAGEKTRVYTSKTGRFQIDGVACEGVRVPHDEAGGKRRGYVVAYRLAIDGLSISHLGDIGTEKLEDTVLERLKSDILMIPVGGVFTVGPAAALALTERLNPRLVIPMHYWIRGITLPLEPLDSFINMSKYRRLRVKGRSIEVSPEDLPEKTTIVVFEV